MISQLKLTLTALLAVTVSLAVLICLMPTSQAQTWKTAKYDTIWIPITSSQIQAGVKTNAKDSVGLYQLWRRASYQNKGLDFFRTLESLKKEQPENAVLAAMRCAVVQESFTYSDVSVMQAIPSNDQSTSVRRAQLEAAKKLNPKLWLNYMTESNLLVLEQSNSSSDPKVIQHRIQLCKKAISLAPKVSFPYKHVAGFMSDLVRVTKMSDAEAVRYYHKAEQLSPTNCAASLGLAYHYVKPNTAGRQKAIQAVYATIPPGVKLTAPLRKVLLDKGIPVPPGH